MDEPTRKLESADASTVWGVPDFSATAPARPYPPFPEGTRFQEPVFLGRGGMGVVFSAFDPVLLRRVAIKLVISEDPVARVRFTFEARALACVDHPNVIKLLEVGEVRGMPFLVMPLLEGTTLLEACGGLTLAAKVQLLRRVADGVQAAHLKGLLHRDLKPANVMVVTTPEEGPHPYVMDFGLAIPAEGSEMTQMGLIMGTAAYMSPEQASGARAGMDVRSDVYSLGVTAYQLLGGALPYTGTSQLDLLRQVLEAEPRPLTQLCPDLPVDLAVIIHRCLARDPEHRYQSARAFADDLGRFLEGRPIHARPPSLAYRLGKWYGRHRAAALTAVASVGLLLCLGAWMGWLVHRTRLQAQYREHFDQEGERVASRLELAFMAPAHDVRGHVAWGRAELKGIQAEQARLGRLALPPALKAMGRIHLALNQATEAQGDFQKAWNLGLTTPELSSLLAQAETQVYIRARDKLRGQGAPAADLARLDATLRRPALALFEGAKGQAFEAGIAAYLREDMTGAIGKLEEAIAAEPWNHSAHGYLAWCWEALGRKREAQGDVMGAREALEKADLALQGALDVARSSPGYWQDLALLRMGRESFEAGHGGSPGPWRLKALEACRQGLVVDPGFAPLYGWRGEINDRNYVEALMSNRPAKAYLEAAFQDAQRAAALAPDSLFCQVLLARELMRHVEADQEEGRDPGPGLARMETVLDAALRLDPANRDALTMETLARFLAGEQLRIQGQDPREPYRLALEAARKACATAGDAYGTWALVLGTDNALAEAELRLGVDPSPRFTEAAAAILQASKAMAEFFSFLNDQARTRRLQAEWALAQGRDPNPDLEAAEALLARSLKANPRSDEALCEQGACALLRARVELLRKVSPLAHLREARDAYRKAGRLNPKVSEPFLGLAKVALLAGWLHEGGAAALRREGPPAVKVLLERHAAEPRTRLVQEALAKDPAPVNSQLEGHPLLKGEFGALLAQN